MVKIITKKSLVFILILLSITSIYCEENNEYLYKNTLAPKSQYSIPITKDESLKLTAMSSVAGKKFSGRFLYKRKDELLERNINMSFDISVLKTISDMNTWFDDELNAIKRGRVIPLRLTIEKDNNTIGHIYLSMNHLKDEKPGFKLKWIEISNEIEEEGRGKGKGYGKIAYALLKLFILSRGGNSYTIESDFGLTSEAEFSKRIFEQTFNVEHNNPFAGLDIEFFDAAGTKTTGEFSSLTANIIATPEIIKALNTSGVMGFANNNIFQTSS